MIPEWSLITWNDQELSQESLAGAGIDIATTPHNNVVLIWYGKMSAK